MLKQRIWLILQKCGFSLAIAFIIFACLMSLARVLTPWAQDNKAFVEQVASRILNQPIHFEKFTLRWIGADPFIDLHTVTISQLKIERIGFSLNLLQSLWHLRWLPNYFILEGTELTLQQHNDRSWWIKGVGLVNEDRNHLTSLKSFFYWLATQSNIVVDHLAVNVHFYNGDKFLLKNLKLQVRNNYLHHDIVGVGQVSESDTRKNNLKSFRFVFVPKELELGEENFGANFYVNVPWLTYQSAWAPLLFSELKLPLPFHSGKIKAEIWGQWDRGDLTSVQAKIKGRDFVFSNLKNQYHFKNLFALGLSWQALPSGWTLFFHPDNSIALSRIPTMALQFDSDTKDFNYHLKMNSLSWNKIKKITQFFGWDNTTTQAWDRRLHLFFNATHLELGFNMTPTGIGKYRFRTDFTQLRFSPYAQIPGMKNLSGQFILTPKQAKFLVHAQHVPLNAPYLFDKVWPLQALTTTIIWHRWAEKKGFIDIPILKIKDDNLQFEGQGDISLQNHKPEINGNGYYQVNHVEPLSAYVPHHVISRDLQLWLRQAFLKGRVSSGVVRLAQSQFHLALFAEGVDLRYSDEWPVLHEVQGLLSVDNQKLSVQNAKATLLENQLQHINVEIPDLSRPVIAIQGQAEGNVHSAAQFLRQAPFAPRENLAALTGNGQVNLNLTLRQSLENLDEPVDAKGTVHFNHNAIQLSPSLPKIENVNGDIIFHNADFSGSLLNAEIVNQPVHLAVAKKHKQGNSLVQVQIQGLFDPQQWGLNTTLLNTFSVKGKLAYQGTLNLTSFQNNVAGHVALISDLQGFSFHLSPSYQKDSQDKQNVSLEADFDTAKPLNLQFSYQRRKNETDGLVMQHTQDHWKIDLNHEHAKGFLIIPDDHDEVWQANFRYIDFNRSKKSKEIWQRWKTEMDPRHLPAMKFHCDYCFLDEKNLGSIDFNAQKTKQGIRIHSFKITNKKYSLKLAGAWLCENKICESSVDGNIKNQDLGAFLREWKLTDVVNEGYGETDFQLKWPGAPYKPNLAKMFGDIAFNYIHGRITRLSHKTESKLGLGKLLNLLSLQSLPQNLMTGFTRMGKKGFEFAGFKGKVRIENGVGHSDKIELSGPLAWATINGDIDFSQELYNLHMKMVPNMTSSLPIIVGIAGGPLAGALTWLVNQFVGPRIGEVASTEYDIKGSTQHPAITEPHHGNTT